MKTLYTESLTPRLDVSDEVWRILIEGEPEPPKSAVRVQFESLDEADRKAVVAYCEELDCLHEDLDFILFELDQAVTTLYRESLHLERLAIICYSDSFHFRVHAYREKVFRLVNHFLGLKLTEKPSKERDSSGAVRNALNDKLRKYLLATRRPELAELLEVFTEIKRSTKRSSSATSLRTRWRTATGRLLRPPDASTTRR